MDIVKFKRIFHYPCTDCFIMDFNECSCEGTDMGLGGKKHIKGCIGCKSDMSEYFHIIRDYPSLFEIVTPVLYGCEGFRSLRHVCDCLQRANATIDNRCGLHIHIDAKTMTFDHIISIIREYQKLEDIIDSKMSPERRNNQCEYAKSLRELDFEGINNLDELFAIMPDKNYKVNIKSLKKYGTLEFRHHHGSVDYYEIRSWLFFVMLLCDSVK